MQSFADLLFLIEVGLSVDVVGKALLLITDDVVGICDLHKEVSRVQVRILVRMVLNAGLSEGLFKLLLGNTSSGDLKQLVVVRRFL